MKWGMLLTTSPGGTNEEEEVVGTPSMRIALTMVVYKACSPTYTKKKKRKLS
jgi:hypothetical protein